MSLFFPKKVEFILLLNWIHSFVLVLAVASSRGLAYARLVVLDMTKLCLQVCWEESNIS